MELNLRLHDKQIDEVRQAVSHRWADLDKKAKALEQIGIQSNAREKMAVLEEIIQTMEPQLTLDHEVTPPPEAW
jgi:uncharacterized coiled-coil protein SlyX